MRKFTESLNNITKVSGTTMIYFDLFPLLKGLEVERPGIKDRVWKHMSENEPDYAFRPWNGRISTINLYFYGVGDEYKVKYLDKYPEDLELLCTIGNGYGWNKEGFIIEEASGADQDKALYGDWMNAEFSSEIKSVVDRVLSIPEVRLTVDKAKERIDEFKNKRREKERLSNKDMIDLVRKSLKDKPELLAKVSDDMDLSELVSLLYSSKNKNSKPEVKKEKYNQYYPISRSSDIYALGDEESRKRLGIEKFDQSYIDAAKEICQDILDHKEQERAENVEFAIKFMAYHGYEEYQKMIPKSIDKYELLEEIKSYYHTLTDGKSELGAQYSQSVYGTSAYRIHLDDTAKNTYGTNNYFIDIFYTKAEASTFPKGESNDPEFLRGCSIYDPLMESLDRLNANEDIKFITFYYQNESLGSSKHCEISIIAYANDKYVKHAKEEKQTEDNFKKQGFQVGKYNLILNLDKLGISLSIRKPKPLGSSHPNNRNGKEYFSNALQMNVSDGTKILFSLQIDERNFNTCYKQSGSSSKDLSDWMVEEFTKMKQSNPNYGTYDSKSRTGKEGKDCLYAHDFMLWIKNHQDDFNN